MNLTAPSTPRVPFKLVLASIAGVWLAYFALTTLRGWLVGLELFDALLLRRSLVTLGSMAVTLALWPMLRLLDPRPFWIKVMAVLLVALPASVLLAAINQWAFADIENRVVATIGEREGLRIRSDESGNLLVDPLDREAEAAASAAPLPTAAPVATGEAKPAITINAETRADNRLRQLVDVALGRYYLLLAWAALYFSLVNAEQARAAERREGEYRRAAKASELRSLRYQVNPHFLFNTLNSLSALVMTGKTQAAEQMIQTLSTFYRRSLAGDPTGDVALDQEIALQRLYLEIEAVRFPERLRTRFDIPAALADARMPGMILQPLIENSVKYAVSATTRPVTLTVAAREEYGCLVIEVVDDGPVAKDAKPGFGIGLANVRDRLAARYGDAAQISSGPVAGGGWRSLIRLPLEHHD
ncbi:MAG: sensor histidine kinase [Novosphingobium sp.]|jgi:two-component system LytT family sensor kinase|uniref:sensor histidine kinase n=1 Tax=Novosphingobium sp. TaxID=1874826 RepID=UPI00391C4B6D